MLIRTGIFRRLEPSVASELVKQLQPVDFDSGHTVFAQGDVGDRLYIIVSGKVKIAYRSRACLTKI
jgi:CRP-like cAMP-binding protein